MINKHKKFLTAAVFCAIASTGFVLTASAEETMTHDLDEAVFLSDRILALQANPGKVREDVAVHVPRPRTGESLFLPEFIGTRKHIEELIHPADAPAEKETFKIINLKKRK